MKENGLVLNASSYGIEESKAKQLEAVFIPMVEKFKELEDQYNEVLANKEITKEVCADAKTVRNKYVKVRTGTDAVHKLAKEKILVESRAIDGLRNIVKYAATDHEESLLKLEKHFERLENEKSEKLREERSAILAKYETNPGVGDLAVMSDDVWKHYISSVKLAFEQKKEAEKKAEEERIAKEKAEIEERKRIKIENERLKKEAEEKRIADEKAEKERQRLAKIDADRRAEVEKARLELEEKDRKIREEKERKEREAHEAILKKEREAKEKIELELQAKKETELKAIADREAKEKKEAEEARELSLAPDKERLIQWISDTNIKGLNFTTLSKESVEVATEIQEKFNSFKKWAKSEIDKIK